MTLQDSGLRGAELRQTAILELEAHLLGELIRPAHDDYDAARQVYNRAIDRRPALIVRAADAADVIRAVNFATDHDLPLAVRSGGHSMAGHSTVDGGLVLDLSRMRGLSIDPERRVSWAQPGLTWGAYAQTANEFALATSAGDTASVGIGGLALGGGIGWMVRKHGLTVDNMLSVEIVTADGRLLRANADEHPDLFWALRGGGGNFGVATAFQFRLQPAGMVLGGAAIYPATPAVLRGWSQFAVEAPDEVTSIAFVTKAPPAPFIPAEYVGKLVAILGVVCVGDLAEADRKVAPLRRLGTPIVDMIAPMPYPAIFSLTEAAVPMPHAVRSGYMRELNDATLEAVVDYSERMPAMGGLVQLRGLGGAMARVPSDSTAFAHRDKPYLATVIGGTVDPELYDAQRAWTEDLWSVLRPYSQGVYVNFLEDEGSARIHEAYPAATYERLRAVKRLYDPDNVFRLNQNIK